jgi:hypothetical protein
MTNPTKLIHFFFKLFISTIPPGILKAIKMTTPQKSIFDYAVPADIVSRVDSVITIAPKVPEFTKHSIGIQSNSEEKLIERITEILTEADIPYEINNIFMTIHILYRCEPGQCMLRIYKNEGAYKREKETGNFILERDNFSRELHHRWIYWFLEDILLNRLEATPQKLAAYLRDLDIVTSNILDDEPLEIDKR